MARIGIVGTGWGVRVQVPTFREAGHDVVGLAGFHRNKTRQTTDELNVRAFDDWRELVRSADVDLVSIVTPPSEHREMTLAALEAGRHVICEKPTARNAREAEELVAAAAAHPGLVAVVDHELRFLPSWRQARDRLPHLGAVRYAEVRYSSPARGDRTRKWDWWSDASRGGGVWGAVGSHFVDALRYFGMEIQAVRGMMRTIIDCRPFGDATRPVTADDFASVQLRLGGEAVAVMNFSAVSTGPDESAVMTIHAERGAMRFVGEEVLLSAGGAPFETFTGGPMEKRPGNTHGGAFGSGTLHFARALRAAIDEGDRAALDPAATFEDGLAQQRVLDAARRSSSEGGIWIAIA